MKILKDVKITVIDHGADGKIWGYDRYFTNEEVPNIKLKMNLLSKEDNKEFFDFSAKLIDKLVYETMKTGGSYVELDAVIEVADEIDDAWQREEAKAILSLLRSVDEHHFVIDIIDGEVANISKSIGYHDYYKSII